MNATEYRNKIKDLEKKHKGEISSRTLLGNNLFLMWGTLGRFLFMDDVWYRNIGQDWIALKHTADDLDVGFILGYYRWHGFSDSISGVLPEANPHP